ncbi:DUF1329 domain-containing protein [Pseudomonas aeruginosa]|nr:DUF1329 domain-containing protein [Pseudomonas aeruginosa]
MFTGALDRYDFKLVGKKEMLVPYNSYKLVDKSNKYEQLIGQDYLNRDVQRYEKHRVWVVEATVKADKRHSFAKRVFFFDEDSWSLLHVDMYDAKGNLWRVQEGSLWADPEIQACTSFEYVSYDLIARRYIADGFTPGRPVARSRRRAARACERQDVQLQRAAPSRRALTGPEHNNMKKQKHAARLRCRQSRACITSGVVDRACIWPALDSAELRRSVRQ